MSSALRRPRAGPDDTGAGPNPCGTEGTEGTDAPDAPEGPGDDEDDDDEGEGGGGSKRVSHTWGGRRAPGPCGGTGSVMSGCSFV
ncbi:hypothetical protein GCM10010359_66720 [Streptomyces morookaense]|nr:hypothetical protein GCM10010359_66720 [Streptomyces morookaense]